MLMFTCKEMYIACMAYLCLIEFKVSMGSLSLPFFEVHDLISSYFLKGFHYNCLLVCLGELQFLGSHSVDHCICY